MCIGRPGVLVVTLEVLSMGSVLELESHRGDVSSILCNIKKNGSTAESA